MDEDTLVQALYFVFAGVGVALSAWPFARRRQCGLGLKSLYGAILAGHAVLVLLLLSMGDVSGDPQSGLGRALAWIYGLIGHAALACAAAAIRLVDRFMRAGSGEAGR